MTAKPESQLQREIMLGVTQAGARVFRNSGGTAWVGDDVRLPDGSVLIRNPRRVRFGLHVGAPDLIGWLRGRFLGIEIKTRTGRLTDDQQQFLDNIRAAGGIAIEARSVEQAVEGLKCGI